MDATTPAIYRKWGIKMDVKCPYDLNQFLLGEPIFENTFPKEECEQRKFYRDCFHCFSTAIASRDYQLNNDTIKKIQKVVAEWKANILPELSYKCMSKIADILAESEE